MKARLPWLAAFLLVLALGALGGALLARAARLAMDDGAFFGVLIAEFGFLALFLSRILHTGWDALKRELLAKLSLRPDLALPLVLYDPWKPRLRDAFFVYRDAVLLGETDEGFVLLGETARLLLPLDRIKGASTEWILGSPPRFALRLELEDGARYLTFVEKKSFRENRRLALECVERTRARLNARRGARTPPPASP